MKNRKVFFGVALFLAVLTLGIGYAAISNVDLQITGSAAGEGVQENFNVRFTDDVTVDSNGAASRVVVEARKTGDLSGVVNVSKLSAKDETVVVTYTVENYSEDLSAALSLDSSEIVDDNFRITAVLSDNLIAAGGKATVTITITSLNTIIDEGDYTKAFAFTVTADPEAPRQ